MTADIGSRITHDAVEAVMACPVSCGAPLTLAPQLGRLERLLAQQHDLVEVEGLIGVVERAFFIASTASLNARVRGQQNDQRVGIVGLDLFQDATPSPSGSL